MLGDACATGDPKLLAQALLAYPVRPYSAEARAVYRELIEINRKEIPESLRRADDYLK
jgi:alpha-galactosidase/6-phospho-beta-glucosidase family protein